MCILVQFEADGLETSSLCSRRSQPVARGGVLFSSVFIDLLG